MRRYPQHDLVHLQAPILYSSTTCRLWHIAHKAFPIAIKLISIHHYANSEPYCYWKCLTCYVSLYRQEALDESIGIFKCTKSWHAVGIYTHEAAKILLARLYIFITRHVLCLMHGKINKYFIAALFNACCK